MYRISDKQWAIEEGDNIAFVRDGGGELDVLVGAEGAFRDLGTGPYIRKAERVELTIIPEVLF